MEQSVKLTELSESTFELSDGQRRLKTRYYSYSLSVLKYVFLHFQISQMYFYVLMIISKYSCNDKCINKVDFDPNPSFCVFGK